MTHKYRYRKRGRLILGSKLLLMVVVILNVTDCALVMSELLLDIHYMQSTYGRQWSFDRHLTHLQVDISKRTQSDSCASLCEVHVSKQATLTFQYSDRCL